MIRLIGLLILSSLISCSEKESLKGHLLEDISGENVVYNNVVACAASSDSGLFTSVYFYPRPGATDYQLYESVSSGGGSDDFENFFRIITFAEEIFGKLRQYSIVSRQNTRYVVSYKENDQIHLSSIIFNKGFDFPTRWGMPIEQDTTLKNQAKFSWDQVGISNIYFQLIQNKEEEAISGTYTSDLFFDYEDQSNVVFDINEGVIQDSLIVDDNYKLTLMAVGPENWVYGVGEKEFRVD